MDDTVSLPETGAGDALILRVRARLADHPNVRERRMFGGLSFMVDDRLGVAVRPSGELLVRTDPADYDRLLDRGAAPASMGESRTMGRGWLTVPAERIRTEAELAEWVEIGITPRPMDA